MVRILVQVHPDQNIAGKEFPLRADLRAAAHLHDLLGRDKHLFELVAHALDLGLLLDRLGDLLLEARIGMNDIPMHRHVTFSLKPRARALRVLPERHPPERKTMPRAERKSTR